MEINKGGDTAYQPAKLQRDTDPHLTIGDARTMIIFLSDLKAIAPFNNQYRKLHRTLYKLRRTSCQK